METLLIRTGEDFSDTLGWIEETLVTHWGRLVRYFLHTGGDWGDFCDKLGQTGEPLVTHWGPMEKL